MVLRTDYIKFIFIQLHGVVLFVCVGVGERSVHELRKKVLGRQITEKLVDFGRVADTDRKQEISPEDGKRSRQWDCFSIKMSSRALKLDKHWQQSGFFLS